MLYFIDTEFSEDDGKTIDLISLALAAEDGRELYACSTEARLDLCGEWHRKNVLPHLPPYGDPAWMTREQIRRAVLDFTRSAELSIPDHDPKPIFWGYYAATDWVALYQLWGRMLDMPPHYPKWIRELKQLCAEVGNPPLPRKPPDAHNALADARWHRAIYAYLMGIKHNQAQP